MLKQDKSLLPVNRIVIAHGFAHSDLSNAFDFFAGERDCVGCHFLNSVKSLSVTLYVTLKQGFGMVLSTVKSSIFFLAKKVFTKACESLGGFSK